MHQEVQPSKYNHLQFAENVATGYVQPGPSGPRMLSYVIQPMRPNAVGASNNVCPLPQAHAGQPNPTANITIDTQPMKMMEMLQRFTGNTSTSNVTMPGPVQNLGYYHPFHVHAPTGAVTAGMFPENVNVQNAQPSQGVLFPNGLNPSCNLTGSDHGLQ